MLADLAGFLFVGDGAALVDVVRFDGLVADFPGSEMRPRTIEERRFSSQAA